MNFLKLYQKLDDTVSYLLSSVCNEKKLLKEHIKTEKITLVDIGANVGSYVDFISKNFEIKTLYCFEPQEKLVQDLEKISYVKKKHILPFALSNVEKIKKFYEYDVSSQSGFYKINNGYNSLQQIKRIKKIKTKVFDKIFNKNLKINLCKVDTEGEDFNVLKGMKKNLKKGNIDLLKVEMNFFSIRSNVANTYLDIFNYLEKLNYSFISISKTKYVDNKLLLMDVYFKKNKR